jgi:hypothetical protein
VSYTVGQGIGGWGNRGTCDSTYEFDVFRRRQEFQDRRRQIVVRVLDVLTVVVLAVIAALVLKMILF